MERMENEVSTVETQAAKRRSPESLRKQSD